MRASVRVYNFSADQQEIRVMKECSWTKILTIRAGLAPASVLVDDEIVLNVSEKFVSYDAKNKVHKMLAP